MSDLFRDKLQAAAYAKYRTACPEKALNAALQFLKEIHVRTDKNASPLKLALDVGCGSGIITRQLAPHFERVLGTDVSDAQLENARNDPSNPTNVEYSKGSAEKIDLEDSSVQLVCVGNALHWFDFDLFFSEVKRVLVPNGVLMVWSDYLREIVVEDRDKSEQLTSLFTKFVKEVTKPYLDDRVAYVLESYRDIEFPFSVEIREKHDHDLRTTIKDMLGFFHSLSVTQKMKEVNPELAEKSIKHMEDRSLEIAGNLDTDVISRMNGILILCRNC